MGASGRRQQKEKELHFILPWGRKGTFMEHRIILPAEANPKDEILSLRALKKCNLVNVIAITHVGAEALDYLLAKGDYAGLAKLPRDASPTRLVNRCSATGRRSAS